MQNRKAGSRAPAAAPHSGCINMSPPGKPPLPIVLLLVGLLLTAGCAKIADPLPPLVRIPKPTADLAAYQSADAIVLTFSLPAVNMDGSPATTLDMIQVLRLEEASTGGDNRRPLALESFRQQAELILTIDEGDFSDYLKDETFVVRDTLNKSGATGSYPAALRYAVLFVNNKRQAAGFSNQVRITPVSLPPHPSALSAEVTEASIQLRWEAPTENMDGTKPARIAGYNIYRSAKKGEIPERPINPKPVQDLNYEDRNFRFDRTYYYSVSTVGSIDNPYAESLPSENYAVATEDIFPPAPPDNFNAALENGSVILLWAPSPSKDTAGYRLFRRDRESETQHLVKQELLTELSCRDEDTQSGKSYEYTIRAVDRSGNESEAVRTEIELQE